MAYKVMELFASNLGYSCDAGLYEFDSKPKIYKLKADYWQNISNMNANVGYSIHVLGKKERYLLHYNELDDIYNDRFEMFRVALIGDRRLIDIMINIDMVIVHPSSDLKILELYYHNNGLLVASGDKQIEFSYVKAFGYDITEGILYAPTVGNVTLM